MKYPRIAMFAALLLGCSSCANFQVLRPLASSPSLEAHTKALIPQLREKPSHNGDPAQELDAIRARLFKRGYLVKQTFLLPSVLSETGWVERTYPPTKEFLTTYASPAASATFRPVDDNHEKPQPIRVTVIDRPGNIPKWFEFLRRIDTEVTGEQAKPMDTEFKRVEGLRAYSLSHVLANRHLMTNNLIVIDAYYIRHVEGPWLAENPDEPGRRTLTIKNPWNVRVYRADGSEELDVRSALPGRTRIRVRAYGRFAIGDIEAHGMLIPNRPYIDLRAIILAEQ